jgi:hypothetical protein
MAYRGGMLTSAFLVVSSVFLGVKYRQGLKKLKLFAVLLIVFESRHISMEKEKSYKNGYTKE